MPLGAELRVGNPVIKCRPAIYAAPAGAAQAVPPPPLA
jgi:hypothetical protein